MHDQTWKVIRHSGRYGGEWRTLYQGGDQDKAERIYDKNAKNLRQGGVRLVKYGEVVKGEWSPTLRTRW